MRYANTTSVTPEKSQEEIKKALRRYGADKFGVMEERTKAHVMFEFSNLMVQITVSLPDRAEFMKSETGKSRTESAINNQWDQAIRQRWRALLLTIRAKLEAVECGISTLEQEFMAFVMMPDGRPLGDILIPKLHEIAKSGKLPRMLGFTKQSE